MVGKEPAQEQGQERPSAFLPGRAVPQAPGGAGPHRSLLRHATLPVRPSGPEGC